MGYYYLANVNDLIGKVHRVRMLSYDVENAAENVADNLARCTSVEEMHRWLASGVVRDEWNRLVDHAKSLSVMLGCIIDYDGELQVLNQEAKDE